MTNAWEELKPTEGDLANSYELMLDIDTAAKSSPTPTWTNIPDITAFDPQSSPKQKDRATYAHKGQSAQAKVGEDFTGSFQIQALRDTTGEFQPVLVKLLEAARSKGDANVVRLRYYDALGASYAFEVSAGVQVARTNTGNDDTLYFTVTLASQGDHLPIENPLKSV